MVENGGLMRVIGVIGKKRTRNLRTQFKIFIPSKINKCVPDISPSSSLSEWINSTNEVDDIFSFNLFDDSPQPPAITITPNTPQQTEEERLNEERRRLEDEKRRLDEEKKKLEDEKKKLEDEKKKFDLRQMSHFSSESIERRYTTIEVLDHSDSFKQKLQNLINTFQLPNDIKTRIFETQYFQYNHNVNMSKKFYEDCLLNRIFFPHIHPNDQ